MLDLLHCGLILLIALHSGLSSETVYVSRCQEDSFQLFKNITFNSSGPVNLYINGIRRTLIATWESTQKPLIISGYKETLFEDENGTLWIRNIKRSHEGKYILIYNTNNSKVISEVQVNVMVAPTKQCKPKIEKLGSILIASLEPSECGRPPASVNWITQSGISKIENTMFKLPPGNEIGTYSACAETPALKCVEHLKLSEYCTIFTIKGGFYQPVSSEMSDTKIHTYIIITAVVMFVILLILVLVAAMIYRRIKRRKSRLTELRLSDEETKPLSIERRNAMLMDSVKSEATTSEIQLPSPTVLCKICKINKMSMYYLICGHIAKLFDVSSYLPICNNCSHFVPKCTLCMRPNRHQSDASFWTNM